MANKEKIVKEKTVKKAHFVTGKGGVGKSVISAALAYQLSLENQHILLIEVNELSFFEDFLGLTSLEFEPTKLSKLNSKNLYISQYKGLDCLKDYTKHLLKFDTLAKLFFDNPISKSLVQIAPGLQELAILGKITSSPRKHGPPMPFDQLVIDSPASGHFLSLLRAPKALADTISFGPMGEQSRNIDHLLRDPDFTEVHLVTLAEELPITETIELHQQLKKEFGITAKVYLNKMSELSIQDTAALSTELKEHFRFLVKTESWARNELESVKIKFQEIPLTLETDNLKLIESLSVHFKDIS